MKLVKIGGYYALRKWSWFFMSYRYLDLSHSKFWWDKQSFYFKDCLTLNVNHPEFIRVAKERNA